MGLMLISGACNTLLMKFMVLQVVSPRPGGAATNFNYPFAQTQLMMFGELMCLGLFMSRMGKGTMERTFPAWIILIPSMCDWTATTLVNMAYVILPASTIQMCRGCIVLFTCLFSVVFLNREQQRYQLVGVFLVAIGITIVSLQELLYGEPEASVYSKPAWIGLTLTLLAQTFQASMLVIEEKYLSKYEIPPMQMVGLEGLFGSIIGFGLLYCLQYTGVESVSEAIYMMHHSSPLMIAAIASMCSIAVFNWSGVTVTQTSSATARSTIDVSRTALIWAVELLLHWNTFSWLQLVGFIVLTVGTLLYNRIIMLPGLAPSPEKTPLLNAPRNERDVQMTV